MLGAPSHRVDRRGRAGDAPPRTSSRCPVTLAVSLHAADDALREQLVPLNHRYPVGRRRSTPPASTRSSKGRRVTFEYACIAGVNDHPAPGRRARRPPRGAAGRRAREPDPAQPHRRVRRAPAPTRGGSDAFADRLESHGVQASIRRNRGVDIDAACGQLRAREAGEPPRGPLRRSPVLLRPQWDRERYALVQPPSAADAPVGGHPLLHPSRVRPALHRRAGAHRPPRHRRSRRRRLRHREREEVGLHGSRSWPRCCKSAFFVFFGGLHFLGNVFVLVGFMFDVALVALLLHPMSRDYQRIWFK